MNHLTHYVLSLVGAICAGRYWGSWSAKLDGWRSYAALGLGFALLALWWWTGKQ